MAFEARAQRLDQGRAIAVGDHMGRPGDVQAVLQRLAGEVVVDQGGDHPDLRQPIPDRQVVGPVGHEQDHRLAPAQALVDGPMGVTVGRRIHLAIGQMAALEGDRAALAPAVDRRLQVVADQMIRGAGYRVDPPQGADQGLDKLELARDARLQVHDWRPSDERYCPGAPGVGQGGRRVARRWRADGNAPHRGRSPGRRCRTG